MFRTRLHFARGEDPFYNPARARRNTENEQLLRSKGKAVISDNQEEFPLTEAPLSNLDRFLEWATPSIPVHYLSETRMRGWRACNVEFQPYFTLADLWESFEESSAYGAGIPLLMNGTDFVVQYYVPYLSGIQIYVERPGWDVKARRLSEDSDGDCCRDSISDGSSDYGFEGDLKYSVEQWNHHHRVHEATLRMDRLSLREKHLTSQEGSSSDDSEAGNPPGQLLFEFFERDNPYSRGPLAVKILYLKSCFPQLNTLRSCDLLSSSWMSVAWYPIYRIPTGPTLRDLDACFLTFHSLSTPTKGVGTGHSPMVTYPHGMDSTPTMCLPIFGLACYKLKSSIWLTNGGCDWQLANSLMQAADNWLRLRHVHHPDYQFFASHLSSWR